MTKIKFEEATQEAFEAFADEVAEVAPEINLTFYPTPMMGEPYIVVRVPGEFGGYPLIVDVEDSLVIDGEDVHVVEW